MSNRRAPFTQSDLTKVLKAFKDAGLPTPQIVIEPQRLTVSPMTDATGKATPNPWDE
ncbi:hypothetical protein [Gemmobacter sp. LW-1]|uniref:hypothetical protein n=1 Tax=Gemmobacter sp. LW-1 TaxID=1529005 RepID=UPI0013791632|nr:hypothetical protein [Gemmobacter sp. LW-1]